MPAIRIQLAGRKEASIIALWGAHITIGRSPSSTLQVLDRTISLLHAEFVEEGGHYRLHDLGSTNGVFVNGQRVTDYHLRETCKVAFGALECEFLSDIPPELNGPIETLPSQLEVSATNTENAELKTLLKKLQSEIESIQTAVTLQAEARAFAVARDQHENILSECKSLKATLGQTQAEMAELRTTRDDLQQTCDKQRAELEARPTQSDLDSSLAENARLKTRLEALTKDSEALATLRDEHSTLKNAHELLQAETLQLKADRNTSRRENSRLQTTIEVQTRELAALQESEASLSRKMATLIAPEEHQKLAAEHASVKEAHERLQQEVTALNQNLAELTADREALQKTLDAQRAEMESMPKPAEFDALRATNAELEQRTIELTKLSADQAAAAKETQEQLQDEITSLEKKYKETLGQTRAKMAELRTARDDLQQTCDKQKAELEARPTQSDLDSSLAENARLKTRLEALTKDSEALATLRDEHSTLKNAHELLQTETLQLKADRNTSRRENSRLQTTIEVQTRELAALQESEASLSRKMATLIAPEEHQKLAAEHASVKEAHERLQQEITVLNQNLADLAADREALQKTLDAQRAEMETMPKPAEFDALRATNAELEQRTSELTKLSADQATAAKEAQVRLQDEITALNQNLADLATDREALQKTIDAQRAEMESMPKPAELDALRAANAELDERTRELTKLTADQAAAAKEAQVRLQDEVTALKQNLADLATDREALQKTIDAQRAEMEAMPKPAELDALRTANAECEKRARELAKLAADQAAAAKEAQKRLQEELAALKQNLADLAADRETLQKTIDAQRAEMERMPKQAELESLRATNAELKERAEKLTKLAADHASAKELQEGLMEEITYLKKNLTDLTTDREALQKTIEVQRTEMERMPNQAELDVLRAAKAELEKRLKDLTRLAADHATATELQERLEEEISGLKKDLVALTADREALQKTVDVQRTELERLPKQSELESLRATNARLEERVKELTAEIASLSTKLSASYIPREEHQKLVAEYAAMKEAQQRREAELEQVNRRLAESLTQHANVTQTLKAREVELEALRNRPEPTEPISGISSGLNEPRARDERQSPEKQSPTEGVGLEEAFGELGFVIRPVRRDVGASPKLGKSST